MKRHQFLVSLLGVGVAALTLVSCGDDGSTCGTGTTEVNGACVPSSTTTCGAGTTLMGGMCVPNSTCGTGTILMGNQCVPDGTVICDQGTTFNPTSGECDIDSTACAPGTVLMGGVCVPEDETLVADHTEVVEPNDANAAGAFAVPAIGAMTTIHGCVTPRAGVADVDAWIVTAAEPTLLEITADGVGGLAAGFVVQDNAIASLPNYLRLGINLVGDMSKRQVYLPIAGEYVLIMDDSRALLTGEAAGDADTCYYTTVKRVAMPTATAATIPQTTGMDAGNVRVLSVPAGAIENIALGFTQTSTSPSMEVAFIVRRNGAFDASVVEDRRANVPAAYTARGLAPTDTFEIVVDASYNWSVNAQDYTFDFFYVAAQALPTAGTMITANKRNGTIATAEWAEENFFYFDVATAGQLVHFNLTQSVVSPGVTMKIVRNNIFTPTGAYDSVASISTFGRIDFVNEYVRFSQPGRYYFVMFDPDGASTEMYTVTSTLTTVLATPITFGTPLAGQLLPTTGSNFHTLDLTNVSWLMAGITATDWGTTTARVTLYDIAGSGWLDNSYPAVQVGTPLAIAGTYGMHRITHGDARDYLVRVKANGTVGLAPMYTLDIKERPHAVVTPTPGTPLTRMMMDEIAANSSKGFIVQGTPGQQFSAVVSPTAAVDISLERRTTTNSIPTGGTINTGAVSAPETLAAVLSSNFTAFTVTNRDLAIATDLAISITSVAPPYTVTSGALPYSDACVGGMEIMSGQDDFLSPVIMLPASFNSFGLVGAVAGSSVKVSSNGFVTFDPATTNSTFTNAAIPSTGVPNALIAPYWDDLDMIRVCRKDNDTANTVTFQWTGFLYSSSMPGTTAVQYQAVLHTDGSIDLVYGPGHQATGSAATVGVENSDGTRGQSLGFDTAGVTTPSTSRTLTPL